MKKFMKVVATTLCVGIVLSSGLFVRSPIVNAADGVVINGTNFPDKNFRKYVSENCDINGDGVLSQGEIDATKSIKIYGMWEEETTVYDLKGIEFFTSIIELVCCANELTTLDISNNLELRILDCRDNKLTNLNVSKNINLMLLRCDGNKLTTLDVSRNYELTTLSCSDNQLTSLDVSNNLGLIQLNCSGNKLTTLDVSRLKELKILGCSGNQLTDLDLYIYWSKGLTRLSCGDNQLTTLDVSRHTQLEYLSCGANQLTSLDMSKNPELIYLDCANNQLKVLDISKNAKLETLNCYRNQLTSLDVSNNVELTLLKCGPDYLSIIDISNNPILCDICKNPSKVEIGNTAVTFMNNQYNLVTVGLQIKIVANGEILYSPSTQPTSTPTPAPTSVPTAGPIPTAAPTPEASKSVGSFVDRCYEVALGRDADEGGYNYWLDALNNGEICGAQAGYGFIFSGEYANKETTNDEFVTDLYSMYFGRTPDEGGFNYWVGLLNNGISREEVFAGFANSTEFDNLCSDYGVVTGAYIVGVSNDQQGGVNAFVARLYNICLTRRPDQGGQSGWVQKLIAGEVTGTTCSYGFVFSPEFIGKNPSSEEFVACMYRAFFGREPDEAGFTAWVQTLNNGGSYNDVFSGFTGSAEFANLCASYGITA